MGLWKCSSGTTQSIEKRLADRRIANGKKQVVKLSQSSHNTSVARRVWQSRSIEASLSRTACYRVPQETNALASSRTMRRSAKVNRQLRPQPSTCARPPLLAEKSTCLRQNQSLISFQVSMRDTLGCCPQRQPYALPQGPSACKIQNR